ncbi:NUDIX domain-containing protein [Candidatus Woesearchaeota archaeon]|nr:NUDIX domain-containing protein [Candidatus Woesearchaeota archaeon]
MRREKSCGAVVYRKVDDKIEFLLIQHLDGGHWDNPKGHVEPGESEEETAVREILEETGLEVDLVDGFKETAQYLSKQAIDKTVVFFLAVPVGGCLAKQEGEIKDIGWFECDDAIAKATYSNAKNILRKAKEHLLTYRS